MQNLIAGTLIAIGAVWIGYNNGYSSGLTASPEYVRLEREREEVIQAEMDRIIASDPDTLFCDRILVIAGEEIERRFLMDTQARDAIPID